MATWNEVSSPTLQEDRHAFNCIQRGHQQSFETLPMFLALLLIVGLRFPVTAAVAGMAYAFGRLCYFHLYSTGDPNMRYM